MIFGAIHHLHFVGAGGVGMCGLAEVLLGHRLTVSGCDLVESERTERLRQLGARITIGHDPQHLDGVDAVVVTAAMDRGHAEVEAAQKAAVPVVARSELLAALMGLQQGIAVAGTHGKTTTTAMIAFLLTCARLDPTVLIGGRARFLESHARLGRGPHLVCEADEYDRSFLRLRPSWAVVTNIDTDHLECYGGVTELEQAFVAFADRVPFYGSLIACADDAGVQRILPQLTRRVVTYGTSAEAWLRAINPQAYASQTRCTVTAGGRELGQISIPVPGEHNIQNALAAIAVGLELELPFQHLADSLASFSGVARRFEVRGSAGGVTVVDDYAHHPTEIAAAIAGARQVFGGRRLVVVFQPHLFSRTRDLATQFGAALAAADTVMVLPIYPAREKPIPGVSSTLVGDAVLAAGNTQVREVANFDDACTQMRRMAERDDVMLLLGAGDVTEMASMWLGGLG